MADELTNAGFDVEPSTLAPGPYRQRFTECADRIMEDRYVSSSSERLDIDHDPDTGEYTARFDPEAIAPSIAVVEVTGAVDEDDDPRHAPLFEVIEPEALDRLCCWDEAGVDTAIEFTYRARRVRVCADGRINVFPIESDDQST